MPGVETPVSFTPIDTLYPPEIRTLIMLPKCASIPVSIFNQKHWGADSLSLNIVFREILLTPLLLTSWETFLLRQSHTSSWRSVNSEQWRRAADKPALCSYSTFLHISSPPNISAFNSCKCSPRRGGWAGLGWAGLGWAGLGWAGLGWGWGQESYEKCFLKLKVHLFIQFLEDTKSSWASHYYSVLVLTVMYSWVVEC